MRRLATLIATALAVTSLTVASSAPAQASKNSDGSIKTSKTCRPKKYQAHYAITAATKQPSITHIKTYTMPPFSRHKVTKTASFYAQLSSRVRFGGSAKIGASGITKVLTQAEVKVSMQLQAAGKVTTRHSVSVTDTIANPTKHNAQFVFYDGWTHAYGTFRYYYCRQYYLPGQSYGPSYVTYRQGRWTSYNIQGEGAFRCGSGTKSFGALAKAANRIGCAA